MSYQLQLGKPISDEVTRIATEELESAAAGLRQQQPEKRDVAIHEARKSVKKTRALLRLVQPNLGSLYNEENTNLREIGHKLSEFRDAGAIIGTFHDLREEYSSELKGPAYNSILRALNLRKRKFEESAGLEQTLCHIATVIEEAAKRLSKLPIQADGFSAIEAGLKTRSKRGRRAMLAARQHPSADNHHEWRKRVKDHWYHARLLENLWTDVMKTYADSLKKLETWLGDDHNLTVLQDTLIHQINLRQSEKSADRLLGIVEKQQSRLREQSHSLGQLIYAEDPNALVRRLEALWNANSR